jgi:long-chain acyl-CoA synthetase
MPELASLLEKWRTAGILSAENENIPLEIVVAAENAVSTASEQKDSEKSLKEFLNLTRKPKFLQALKIQEIRNRWSEVVFKVLQQTNFTLRDLMDQRVEEHPHKVLFKDMSSAVAIDWTYEQISRHLREIASLFYLTTETEPRVAFFTENCLEGACTDLACLMYGIFDTPLSPHFNVETLLPIFKELNINIALADTEDRLSILKKVREQSTVKFNIISLQPVTAKTRDIPYLVEESKKISRWDIDVTLAKHKHPPVNQVATTMFTSGSTGVPKGVSFSIYNIVSKRFARAAALPEVGEETFLCFLPLYHTFGRYLEMTGAIFWSGTYIFSGNTSSETLFSLFPKMNPTGFISIPLRWQELYERCQEKIGQIESPVIREKSVREIVGQRLHWGLSAAGYLDPSVFRFFNEYGIHLNSGFGMTEATGGITMTPPGKYREFTVGIPLPGVMTKITADSELTLSGHYIGRYLENAGPGDTIPFPVSPREDWWLSTGDVFRINKDGYYEIIDRVKDIYKNNRGQTVAPQVIEKKFYKVPGIKSVFLVGDNRPYNVLLIVPDKTDPIFESLTGENVNEYFHQIVMAANQDVAPYERVINFSVLDREFDAALGELTPKGSYNRKAIEANFRESVEVLYLSNVVKIAVEDFTLAIPKWFYRDLGILETDIRYDKKQLVNRRTGNSLTLKKLRNHWYQVGDLKYRITAVNLDLGIFTRQPKLWLGNAELVGFCPVKEGWDLNMENISSGVFVSAFKVKPPASFPLVTTVRDQKLFQANNLLFTTYFGQPEDSYAATVELGKVLTNAEPRLAIAIRHRLEALAYHPDEELRCLAYRLILLKAPRPEEISYMPAFIESGLPFLNEKSIREIAGSNFGKHRLDALKQRLYWYRTNLKWPGNRKSQQAFGDVLGLLYNFAVLHLEYYVPVRAELSRWILHKQDPYLSGLAETYFYKLAEVFEKDVETKSASFTIQEWKSKVVFEHGISDGEKQRMLKIFQSTTFLKESILLTFNDRDFDPGEVPDSGIWVLRLLAFKEFKHYRLSINTTTEKHFDIHLVMSESADYRPKPDTFYWLASLAGFPQGPAVAPMLGSSRPNLGILTTQYIGGLTAWDKIRELAEIDKSTGNIRENAWRKIFIKSFSIVYKAWHHSGFQIVPGNISPSNVSVPELDFKESAVVLSLAGWSEYKDTLSLVEPMLRDFFCKTASIYPWCRKQLDVNWIFDACIEALGKEQARKFLTSLKQDLIKKSVTCFDEIDFKAALDRYLETTLNRYYLPVAMYSAIDQYADWYRMNPLTTTGGKEQTILELMELYKLGQFAELVRYWFYRHTYFSDATESIRVSFDNLLARIRETPDTLAIQLVELSDLQATLVDAEDKNIFSRMVFPRHKGGQGIDFLLVGESQREHVVVMFSIQDKSGRMYTQREPIEPREIGQLYQLFFRENYPKDISDHDHQQIITDANNKIIGGLTYRYLDDHNILLDGMVVISSLQGKGLASSMMRNFFSSMAAQKIKVVKAHFLFGNYYLKNFFEVDKKWGALIKTLN